MNTYSDALSLSRSSAWRNDTSENLTSFVSVETYSYSICSGTMSEYICVFACVHVCVCIDAQSWCWCVCSHAYEHICKLVSRLDLAKWAVHQFWFTSGNELAASWTSVMVEASRPPIASCGAVAAPEVNIVACSETRPALYQNMEHICVSCFSFCALISLIWDQSHCWYNDIMCFCG